MNKTDVVAALNRVREATTAWTKAMTAFRADSTAVTRRLVMEAAINYMSVDDIAAESGFTRKQITTLLRNEGLDPRQKKPQLAKNSARVLADNAALLGVDPGALLLSPLAYLPAGQALRREVDQHRLSQVTEVEETVLIRIDKETWDEHQENGECPVSSGCCGCHLDSAVLAE